MSDLLSTLETETFILYLATQHAEAPSLKDSQCVLVDPQTIEVTVGKNTPISNIINELAQKNIAITSIKNKRNRLEELFMNITNKST